MRGLEVRPIRESDLTLLAVGFDEGSAEEPERGLELQRTGKGDFLVARVDGIAVGQAMLRWDREPHAPPDWQGKVANLQDLLVLEASRSQGIGTEIMRVAEAMALERGFERLSLGVGVDNPDARRLYERLGYRDAGLPPIEDGGSFRRWDGTTHEWRETWEFMVKDLRPSKDAP